MERSKRYPGTHKIIYHKLDSIALGVNKRLVISSCSEGGFTLAQQARYVDDDGSEHWVFLKGATHIPNVDALIDMQEMIQSAIHKSCVAVDGDRDEIDKISWDM